MTKPNINPYEPVAETVPIQTPIEPLCFSGVIEKADYQAMLPNDQEWWLCVVLVILLGICILVFGPITVWLAIVEVVSVWLDQRPRVCYLDRFHRCEDAPYRDHVQVG